MPRRRKPTKQRLHADLEKTSEALANLSNDARQLGERELADAVRHAQREFDTPAVESYRDRLVE